MGSPIFATTNCIKDILVYFKMLEAQVILKNIIEKLVKGIFDNDR